MALFPSPFILGDFPSINNIPHKIQRFTGVVFEKIVELFCLTISSSKMNIRNEYGSVGFWFT